MDYTTILSANTRSDDYVNATKLCKAFNKEWNEFKRLPETKKFVKVLEVKLGAAFETGKNPVSKVKRVGKTWETHIHPLLAIKLAEWLSPEFDVCVKETFKRYVEGDVSLATELVNRSTDKAAVDAHIEAAKEHSQYLDTYHGLHKEMKEHGCHGMQHAVVNKHINDLVGVEKGKREEMTRKQKLHMMAAQAMGESALISSEQRGWNAVSVVKRASSHVLSAAK